MRTKEEIQGEIDKVKGFIKRKKKQLETRKNPFDREILFGSIFYWNFQIEKLTKELEELEKINKEKEEWKSMIKMAETITSKTLQKKITT
jgi:hypothetical protein